MMWERIGLGIDIIDEVFTPYQSVNEFLGIAHVR
jgi:hypothetical protein